MIEIILKLGLGGGIGFLIGLAVVSWVKPVTSDGTVLLIAVCIVVSSMLGTLMLKLVQQKKTNQTKAPTKKPKKRQANESIR